MKVSSDEFQKQFGSLADKALIEPLTITRNGRDRLVLLSIEEYERLKRRDRWVVCLADFTDAEMALIATSDVPPRICLLGCRAKRLATMSPPDPEAEARPAARSAIQSC